MAETRVRILLGRSGPRPGAGTPSGDVDVDGDQAAVEGIDAKAELFQGRGAETKSETP